MSSLDDLELLTVPEVAEILRKPALTLRYWPSIDKGPRSHLHGSTVVYRRSAVEAWIAEQEKSTARGGLASSSINGYPV